MENVVGRGIHVLIPPDPGLPRASAPVGTVRLYAFMRRVLSTDHGKALYRKRHATIEPVFGQMKFNRRLDRFVAAQHGARLAGRRAALGLAAPGAAGAWAARAALEAVAHDEALSFVDELVGLGSRRSRWPRAADPARVIEEWTRTEAGVIGRGTDSGPSR
jgi:Transposase DDE domain